MFQNSIYKNDSDLHIFELISSKKWNKVKTYISKNQGGIFRYRGACDHKTCNSGHNALQFACYFQPPLDIIKGLHAFDPTAIRQRDCQRNFALHVACAHGCSPSVIEYLVTQYPQAAQKTNKKNRNACILACKTYLPNNKNKSKSAANKDLLKVLQALGEVAPMSFIKEDSEEMSALDYAFETDVDMMVIRYIQWVSLSLRRQIQKRNSMEMCKLALEDSSSQQQQHTSRPAVLLNEM